MKPKGLLLAFLLAGVVVYFLWFGKTGAKPALETGVDRLVEAQKDLTLANMREFRKIILSYIAGEGQTPLSLEELRKANLMITSAFDAWGQAIKYERISDSSFRLVSAGKDKIFGTPDDVLLED